MAKTKDKTVYKGTGLLGWGEGTIAGAVDVKDGRIARIRPMDFTDSYTEAQLNPWEVERNGVKFTSGTRSFVAPFGTVYKKRVYSGNRVPYPLKRVDWAPGGDPDKVNAQNRGKSKFRRISWDEATDIIASEIRRMEKQYGLTAVFCQGDGHGETKLLHAAHGCNTRLMDVMGDYTVQARQPDSWEGWYWGAKHIGGMDPLGEQNKQANTFYDITKNADAVVFWGCDLETTPWGWGGMMPSQINYFWSEAGIKSIYICPDLNYAAAAHADKWVPVLPNTDAALQLGIIHTWITEDSYDKDYIETHSLGFDNFANYVLGGEDGEPKCAKWASEICGVPSRQIKALARYLAKTVFSIAHCNGGGMIRAAFAHEPARLIVALLAMQGVGKPGRNQFKFLDWGLFGYDDLNPMPRPAWKPFLYAAYTGHVQGEGLDKIIPQTLVPNAIMLPEGEKLSWYSHCICTLNREDQFNYVEYPAKGASRIHMFWTDTPCWTTCWNGGFRLHEALRHPSIEFVLVQHPWMENDSIFADIILPISTKFEQDDIGWVEQSGVNNVYLDEAAAVEPVGEAKSDSEAVLAIAEKLGLKEALLQNYAYGVLASVADTQKGKIVDDQPTADELPKLEDFGEPSIPTIKKFAYHISGLAEQLPYDEFLERGYIPAPFVDGWENDTIGLRPFAENPDANPLETPTGKIEFYSTGLAQNFPDDEQRPPVPHWIAESDQHKDRLFSERGQDYPFLLVTNHPRFRHHANLDDVSWLREIDMCKVKGPDGYLYEPVWINPLDARPRGLKEGDIVKVYNERGATLGGIRITERIIPRAISQDHGARVDSIIDGPGGLDRGGANNLFAPSATTSQNAPGEVTNSYLVNIEKVDVFELAKLYPEAFSRAYDPGEGLQAIAYIEEA
jgi:trimethylamine-N-oxide reductase (cytochrome c)